jgi:hypothetical protein
MCLLTASCLHISTSQQWQQNNNTGNELSHHSFHYVLPHYIHATAVARAARTLLLSPTHVWQQAHTVFTSVGSTHA